jgi:2-alkenal reductase
MSKKTIQKIIALIVIFVLLSACGLTSILSRAAKEMRETVPTLEQVFEATPTAKAALPEPPAPSFNPVLEDNQDLLEALYEHVSPGVVSIQGMGVRSGGSQGTGFVVDTQGHIVTNYHVVEGQDTIEVHFQSGLKSYASIVGKDIDSDLAVIKVDVDPSQLVPLVFGDSDLVKVGQTVAAIGNPYGLSGTMTVGVVSARGRILDSMRQSSSGGYFSSGDTIQTDALINPGNSGGPLLNLNGEVIGVNRAIQTSGISITGDAINTGIGFAISSNVARKVVPSLIEKGSFEYPYLGMTSLSNISLSLQEALDLPQSVGVYISDVVQGGPADKAGLRGGTQPSQVQGYYKGGDLIIAVDGISVKDFSEMFNYIVINKNPGDVVVFTVIRDGHEMDINLTVEARR